MVPWPCLQVQRKVLGRLRPLCYAWLSTAFLAAGDVVLPRSELDKVARSGLQQQLVLHAFLLAPLFVCRVLFWVADLGALRRCRQQPTLPPRCASLSLRGMILMYLMTMHAIEVYLPVAWPLPSII